MNFRIQIFLHLTFNELKGTNIEVTKELCPWIIY